MKKLVTLILLLGLTTLPIHYVGASSEKKGDSHQHEHHHKHIDCEKAEELKEKGYSKQDIFMGAMLAKKSNKEIENVLEMYKENKSWEKTAEQLGIAKEEFERIKAMREWGQFVKDNPDAVKEYLASYSNMKMADIESYIDEDISLRFLIGASVLAKLSDKKLEEMVAYKKDGKTFHDILKELNIDKEALHKEFENFRTEAQKKTEKQE